MTRSHITIILYSLMILSGCLFYSILSETNHVTEQAFSNTFNSLTGESDNDFQHSRELFSLVFEDVKENAEKPAGMNGLASIKQGIQATEASSIKISIDKTYYFKRANHLLVDNHLKLLIKAIIGHYSYSIKLFSTSIAINAP